MPLPAALLLYACSALLLVGAGGIGLVALVEPANRAMYDIAHPPDAVAVPIVAATTGADEPPPDAASAHRLPAWIAPTPVYDLPPPQTARRDLENAKKAAAAARKARIAKQRRKRPPLPGVPAHPPMNNEAGSAYGYAAPPRIFFRYDIP